jgi:hypothetical protein
MKYRSVCSGIEGATVAWEPLGFKPVSFAEVDPFCCSLLKHHYPDVPNVGDFTKDDSTEPSDILVGGTPCQDFSVAGLRAGMAGDRGNLTLEFLRLLREHGPDGWYGRTSPASCRVTTDGTLEPFSEGWGNSGMGSLTEFLTLSSLEFPSGAVASSLSDILETGDLPQRYFLSATACKGILRRAEKRGKTLPGRR